MTSAGHPPWCDPGECTALPASNLRVQRGGAHRSAVVHLSKDASISNVWGPLTAQLQQASTSRPTPTVLLLTTGGDPISLTLDPQQGLGQLVLSTLTR